MVIDMEVVTEVEVSFCAKTLLTNFGDVLQIRFFVFFSEVSALSLC